MGWSIEEVKKNDEVVAWSLTPHSPTCNPPPGTGVVLDGPRLACGGLHGAPPDGGPGLCLLGQLCLLDHRYGTRGRGRYSHHWKDRTHPIISHLYVYSSSWNRKTMKVNIFVTIYCWLKSHYKCHYTNLFSFWPPPWGCRPVPYAQACVLVWKYGPWPCLL